MLETLQPNLSQPAGTRPLPPAPLDLRHHFRPENAGLSPVQNPGLEILQIGIDLLEFLHYRAGFGEEGGRDLDPEEVEVLFRQMENDARKGLLKGYRFFSKLVEVWCYHIRVTIKTHYLFIVLIGKKKNYICFLFLRTIPFQISS